MNVDPAKEGTSSPPVEGHLQGRLDKAAEQPESGIPPLGEVRRHRVDRKGVFAIALLALSLVAVSSVSIHRFLSRNTKDADDASKHTADQPNAAAFETRRLDMTAPRRPDVAPAPPVQPVIPALEPLPEDQLRARAVPMRSPERATDPRDAPSVLLAGRPDPVRSVSASTAQRLAADRAPPDAATSTTFDDMRRNLTAYQARLQAMLDNGSRAASAPAATALLGSRTDEAAESTTSRLNSIRRPPLGAPTTNAALLANRSLVLPKGTTFTCALKTRIVTATSGLVACQVQRHVYGEDGRVLLLERGSHLDGEYQISSIRPGTVRIPVVWTRARTPNGIVVALDSPGTGALGEPGIDGYVDNRWPERIGAAMLLFLIDDSVKLIVQGQANDGQRGSTVVLQSTTTNSDKLAEKVLDSTINIPPLIYQNQGGVVGIYVARDVDFSSVYELRPVTP